MNPTAVKNNQDNFSTYSLNFWQRVSTALLGSMLLLAILITAMGAVAFFEIQSTSTIVKESMVLSNGRYLGTRIRIDNIFLSHLVLQYVISENDEERIRLRVVFEEVSRRINELFRQAKNTFKGKDLDDVHRVEKQVNGFLKEALIVMDSFDKEGHKGNATQTHLYELTILRDPMLDQVRTLEDIETANLDKQRLKSKMQADKFTWMILLGIGGTLFLALFIMYLNIRRIFFPLIEIQKAVESVASGKLDHPIHSSRQDEFGVLAQAFNHMMAQLRGLINSLELRVRHRTEELLDSNQKLQEEILERKNTEENLIKAFNELKNVQRQLIQSEKMAMVGQLATGVVHEINNPVAFLMGNLHMLKQYAQILLQVIEKHEELERSISQENTKSLLLYNGIDTYKAEVKLEIIKEDLLTLLDEMDQGFERIRKIILDLKTFAHSDNMRKEKSDINHLIDAALNIAKNELKYKVEVIKHYANLPPVDCYPQQLNQVFINLLVNAAQAIPKKGVITIKTAHLHEHVLIEIADTGTGMTEEVLAHLFEPFFTTKPPGTGTGLGLSISYSLIEKHKGSITVKSTPGHGTIFSITIPLRNET